MSVGAPKMAAEGVKPATVHRWHAQTDEAEIRDRCARIRWGVAKLKANACAPGLDRNITNP